MRISIERGETGEAFEAHTVTFDSARMLLFVKTSKHSQAELIDLTDVSRVVIGFSDKEEVITNPHNIIKFPG